jgi:hypothetical protein
MRRTIFFFAVAFFLLIGGGHAMAIEQPAYQVELDAKPFQIRLYPPMIEATIHVGGTRSAAVNTGFRSLAGYIFGDNRKKSKIAMTAPVRQNAGEKIAMTAPVSQNQAVNGWDIRFIMPADATLQTLPEPNDGRIHLVDVPSRRFAVVSFSGFWSDTNFQSHQAALMKFIEERGLSPVSPPIYAYYDPPWTPWFLRKNEVQVEIAK